MRLCYDQLLVEDILNRQDSLSYSLLITTIVVTSKRISHVCLVNQNVYQMGWVCIAKGLRLDYKGTYHVGEPRKLFFFPPGFEGSDLLILNFAKPGDGLHYSLGMLLLIYQETILQVFNKYRNLEEVVRAPGKKKESGDYAWPWSPNPCEKADDYIL